MKIILKKKKKNIKHIVKYFFDENEKLNIELWFPVLFQNM